MLRREGEIPIANPKLWQGLTTRNIPTYSALDAIWKGQLVALFIGQESARHIKVVREPRSLQAAPLRLLWIIEAHPETAKLRQLRVKLDPSPL